MNNNFKKPLSLALAFVMIPAILPANAHAQGNTGTEYGNVSTQTVSNSNKNDIISITCTDQPKLNYKYGDENKNRLDLSNLSVTLLDSNFNSKVVRFADFSDYGLTTNYQNGQILTQEDNGKKIKISITSSTRNVPPAETNPLSVTSGLFDESNIKTLAFKEDTKKTYIAGDKLDLDNLKIVLTDTNDKEKEFSYKDSMNKFNLKFDGKPLEDRPLTKADDGKILLVSLSSDSAKEDEITIKVLDFEPDYIQSIEVKNQPRLRYSSKEKLDLSKLSINLVDQNGLKKEVKFNDFASNSISTDPKHGTILENQNGPIRVTLNKNGRLFTTNTGNLEISYLRPKKNDYPLNHSRSYRKFYIGNASTNKKDKKDEEKNTKVTATYVLKIGETSFIKSDNGKDENLFTDVSPIIKDSRLMLPLRFISDLIGADVKWDASTRTAQFTKDGLSAKIQIDGKEIVLSNGKIIKLDSKVLCMKGRILLPLTKISQIFSLTNGNSDDGIEQDIEWDKTSRTIKINVK